MNGLSLWFARDAATRIVRGDPRPSLTERYRDEADYARKVLTAARDLVAGRYLLEEDVERVVKAALVRYRRAMVD
jgi:hypothetical protein